MRSIDLRIVALFVVSLGLVWFFWPSRGIVLPEGATAPDEPLQEDLEDPPSWTKDDFLFTALASYEVKARVLSRERYFFDDGAALSPIDFVLGWGDVSDQAVIDSLDLWQGGRRYRFEVPANVLSVREISRQSANVHMIPANDRVEDLLLDIDKGALVTFTGKLVLIEGDGGWIWKSSLTRDDTGDGSCEVFWVEDVMVHPSG